MEGEDRVLSSHAPGGISMKRAWPTLTAWLRLRRWLAAGLCAGIPWTLGGCTKQAWLADYPVVPPTTAYYTQAGIDWAKAEPPSPPPQTNPSPSAPVEGEKKPANEIRKVSHTTSAVSSVQIEKELPITLDAVLRLAEQHNPRIALAREKLNESQLTMAQGARGWLPNTYASVAYYRHEGGIQQFDGTLTHSSTGAVYPGLQIQSELDLREGVFQLIDLERRIWQQKAELSQINNEVLLEAGLTYIDLLSARRGEALTLELEKHEKKLLDRAEKLAKTDRGAAALVEGIKATLSHRHQLLSRLRQNGNAASAKLVYLLGLPPGTCLKPVDLVLAPIELVDATPLACDLIEQAWTGGPGIRELQGILGTVELALEKTSGSHNLLPAIQFNVFEGPFGAGPGASLQWDNRLDIGLQFRWNLTQMCQTESKRNLIRSKQAQVMLTYEELKAKLALGVQESRDSILAGREQIGLATSQIEHANESYRLSERRLEEGVAGASSSEVLVAIRSLEQAHFNHLQAIQGHNKAQLKLLMLLGGGPERISPAAEASSEGKTLPAPKPVEKQDKHAPSKESRQGQGSGRVLLPDLKER